jgi:predicted nucleic acid-binding protein
MLTDAGPIIAIIDEGDPGHTACMAFLATLPKAPLATTWACFTEAMYLLDSVGGYRFQERLWRWRRDGRLILLDVTDAEADRMDVLMQIYQNVPMDLADASLVAIAESRRIRRLFTLDSDFYIYRLADGSALEAVR